MYKNDNDILKLYARYILIAMAHDICSQKEGCVNPIYEPSYEGDLQENLETISNGYIYGKYEEILNRISKCLTCEDIKFIKYGYLMCKKCKIKILNNRNLFNITNYVGVVGDIGYLSSKELDEINIFNILN